MRSIPRYFSAARLISRYCRSGVSFTMIGVGTFSMMVSRNERVRSSSASARLRSVMSSCVATQPPSVHRLIDHRDRAAVLQLDGEGKGLAPLERLAQVRFITLRVERECSRGDARFKQIAHGASPPDAVRVDPVHLPVSLVPDNQAILRIKHAQTLMHVVESFVEPKMLLAAVAANLPTEYRCQQCKECRGDEHRLRG